jgi:hypothetical protein
VNLYKTANVGMENLHISKNKSIAILVIIILFAFSLRLWGMYADLPLAVSVDEPPRISNAVRMVAEGDLNPAYFNHPSSTVIYPLAAIFHIWNVVFYDGTLFQPAPTFQERYEANWTEYIYLARFLTVTFATLSIPLVYQLGRLAFNELVGLIGAWFATLPLILKSFAQIARDDITATFFGLLSLYLCLHIYLQPNLSKQVKAGIAIGLGIATRYFMATLVPIFALANLLAMGSKRGGSWQRVLLRAMAGLIFVELAFVLSTPYLFLNLSEALYDINLERRDAHLGADGLSNMGNFMWYLTQALPANNALTWALFTLALLGIALTFYTRNAKQFLLLTFIIIFLVGISSLALHWQRWLIPTIPVFALFAASGLQVISQHLYKISSSLMAKLGNQRIQPLNWAVVVLLIIVSARPVYRLVLDGVRLSNENTRLLARYWLLENVPENSKLGLEEYTAFQKGLDDYYRIEGAFSLATTDWTLDQAYHSGFEYILVSSAMYNRFYAEPDRYQLEINRYEELFAEEILVQEIRPTYFQRGPIIQIYKLRER